MSIHTSRCALQKNLFHYLAVWSKAVLSVINDSMFLMLPNSEGRCEKWRAVQRRHELERSHCCFKRSKSEILSSNPPRKSVSALQQLSTVPTSNVSNWMFRNPSFRQLFFCFISPTIFLILCNKLLNQLLQNQLFVCQNDENKTVLYIYIL